jgi:hypothetical protein
MWRDSNMGARFSPKQKSVAELMRKHWKNPEGKIVRYVAEFLDRPGIMAIVCRDGAAYVRPYDPLPPDSSSLKDTSIGLMLAGEGSNIVFSLSPVEFKYVNKCWWEAINGNK